MFGSPGTKCSRHPSNPNPEIGYKDFPAAVLPRVQADPIQLDLLFLNHVQNAIEAIDANHSVDRRITIRAVRRAMQGVEVSVEDTGGGIAPQIRANLFHLFNTTKPRGVGLGLLSCQRFAQAHGGTLSADSVTGVGARFCVTLPCAADAKGTA